MNRILLIGCGKEKRAEACAAKDLYIGRLFVARRKFAERAGLPWFILSALHGLVNVEEIIKPYDKTMPTQRHAMARWADRFKSQFVNKVEVHNRVVVEIHAGADYVAPVRLALAPLGITIEHPVFGMGIGEQMAFYNSRL